MNEMIIKGKVVSTRLRIKTLEELKKELNEDLKNVRGVEAKQIKEQIAFIQMIIEDKTSSNTIPDFKKEKELKKKKEEPKQISGEPKEEKEKKPKAVRSKSQISTKVTKLPENLTSYDDEDEVVESTVYGLSKMSDEIRQSIVYLDRRQLRNIVDTYHQVQTLRISTENQVRAYKQGYDGEGNKVPLTEYVAAMMRTTEEEIKKSMAAYALSNPVTKWASDIVGIGPVISSSLYAYFDVEGIHHSGNFCSYAGLNNNNNPWYGKDNTKMILSELTSMRDIKAKAFEQVCKDLDIKIPKDLASKAKFDEGKVYSNLIKLFGEKKITELCAAAREIAVPQLKEIKQVGFVSDLDYSGMTIDEMIENNCVNDPGYGLVSFDREFFIDDVVDYSFYLSDKNVMSTAMLMMVYEKTGQHRKVTKIREHSKVVKEDDKYLGLVTKESLQKYLSKPPYNQRLKVLMYKIGDSFIKKQNHPDCLYGRIYKDKLAELIAMNEAGKFKHDAALALKKKRYDKNKDPYKTYIQGKLPMAQLIARARRFAVKVFLDHFFRVMYIYVNHKMPSYPYPITFLGHTDFIQPPVPFDKYFNFEIDWTPDNMKMV